MKGAPRCGQPHLIEGNKLLVAAMEEWELPYRNHEDKRPMERRPHSGISEDLKPEFPDFVVYNGYAYGFDVGMFCCSTSPTENAPGKMAAMAAAKSCCSGARTTLVASGKPAN